MDNLAMVRDIWEPLATGESEDYQPFFDSLDDDIVFTTSVGELRGKPAVVHYFAHAWEVIEARPFEKPLEYYGDGDRVVVLGEEAFKIKESGVTAHADWAWVHDVHQGKITKILAIQDLSAVAETVKGVFSRARSSS